MGNNSSNKNKKRFCCLCTSHSISIDETSFPTFDRILSENNHKKSLSDKKRLYHYQSIEDLEKSLHNSASINQWIDSLPILGTPSLNRLEINPKKSNFNEQFKHILTRKSNREILNLTKKFRLNFYLHDYLNRLKNSNIKQTFKTHFSSSTIIYPSNPSYQYLTDDLNLFLSTPPESILPNLFINTNSASQIHEQLRAKCYFIPLTDCKIEPNDDVYQQKSIPLDRTHVVITLENKQIPKTDKIPIESEPSFIFVSNDSFQTGFIRIDQEKLPKQFSPFISYYSEENVSYLSSNLIQQWFNTLMLVNQTCAIAKRFLLGNKNHITCLLKEQTQTQSDKGTSRQYHNNLTFAALRLPSNNSSSINFPEEKSEKIIDAFCPIFLSDNKTHSNNTIHIDSEQYSFAFLLSRWPKCLIDNYSTHPKRYSKRQWPSKSHMKLITKKSLLLVPNSHPDQWEINFDLIEDYLFELMNELALFFYILCQQLFSYTYSNRLLIKHCFLNYCEKYGLPFSKNQKNIFDLINQFLKELNQQINKKFFPNYFNHRINLLNSNENYNPWFDYINQCIHQRIYLTSSSSLINVSNRSIIIEFLFYFIEQLYQTFHIKRSEFYLNDEILLNLHKELCEKLSNDSLNNQQTTDNIQMNLTNDFEANAELVHICLNQIRKAQTSLIFHYTWTIFIQYLHTYYNVLWNISR